MMPGSQDESAPLRRGAAHWAMLACAPLAWLGLFALGTWFTPDPRGFGTHEQIGLPACSSMEYLGVPCPGCGVTTSVALAARGQLVASFQNQPFGILVALLGALFPIWAVTQHLRGRELADELGALLTTRRAVALGAAMLAAWVYKLVLVA